MATLSDADVAVASPPSADSSRRERWRFALYAGYLLSLAGLALSNLLLGAAVVAFPFLRDRTSEPFRRGKVLLLCAGAYAALLVVSIALSQDPRTSFSSTRELFTLAAFPLALAAISSERRLRSLVDALIVMAALVAVFGLAQFLVGYGAIDRRIRGPFSHVMTFSGVLLLIDVLLLARLVAPLARETGVGRWLDRPWVMGSTVALINAALMQSLTRSAWLGLLSGLGWLLWVRRRRWLLAAPVAAALVILIAPVPVVARALSIANLSDESTYDRLCMLEAGWRMTAEHPLVGVGPGLVQRRYPIYRHPTATRLNVPHLHNSYVELAAERGVPSLLAFLALLGVSIHAAWSGYREELAGGGGRSDLYLGVIAALIAFAVAALFENNWGDTEVQRLAIFLLAAPFCVRPVAVRAAEGAVASPVP